MASDGKRFLEELYRENYAKLLRFAMIKLENDALAQEIVHDVFLEALLRIDTLLNHPKPAGWLMTTLKYKILSYERRKIRDAKLLTSLHSVPPPHPADQICKLLELAVEQILTPKELRQWKQILFEGKSHREYAVENGISVWTSEHQLVKIRKKLRRHFSDR